jgi:hypothetical protein
MSDDKDYRPANVDWSTDAYIEYSRPSKCAKNRDNEYYKNDKIKEFPCGCKEIMEVWCEYDDCTSRNYYDRKKVDERCPSHELAHKKKKLASELTKQKATLKTTQEKIEQISGQLRFFK